MIKSSVSQSLIVVKVDAISDNNLTITAEVETLHSDPRIRVLHAISGREFLLPLQDAFALNSKLASTVIDIEQRLTTMRRELYHPIKEAEYLVLKNSDSRGDQIILKESQNNIANSDPVLIWCGDNSGQDSENNGWRLSLIGFEAEPYDIPKLSLGFARWDDKEGIMSLAHQMLDREGLSTMAALISPRKSSQLIALDVAIKADIGQESGILPSVIYGIIKDSPELADSMSTISSLAMIEPYHLFGNAVALSVILPGMPLFRKSVMSPKLFSLDRLRGNSAKRKLIKSLVTNQMREYEKLARETEIVKWRKLFLLAINAHGWRQVDINGNRLTITPISVNNWSKIEPFIGEGQHIGRPHLL